MNYFVYLKMIKCLKCLFEDDREVCSVKNLRENICDVFARFLFAPLERSFMSTDILRCLRHLLHQLYSYRCDILFRIFHC
jgi:hypothetical protein